VDIPSDHILFRTLFDVPGIPQVPSINFQLGIFDDYGRIMVLMTHNADIADSWEREGEDPQYFYRFSVADCALAVNVLIYAMTQ
jgi:hypothetical protein